MRRYKEVAAQAADCIVEELGAQVVFLPMQYPEDVKTAEQVAAMAKNDMVILPEEYNTNELLSIVGNMDLLIAVRLHALIFAGVMGIPMIGISYDPKIDRFLEYIGEKAVGDLQKISLEELMGEVRCKWNDKAAFKARNAELLAKLRVLAVRNAELAFGLIQDKME